MRAYSNNIKTGDTMYAIERVSDETLESLQKREQRGARKYPFGEMKVGDSFFVEDASRSRVKSAARAYASRTGYRFAYVKDECSGMRVVRIA